MLMNRRDTMKMVQSMSDVYVGSILTVSEDGFKEGKIWVKADKQEFIALLRKTEDNEGRYNVDISEEGNVYIG
jgi:hypothetical protein